MKRREFFKKAGVSAVGAAGAATLATPALSQGSMEWIAVSAFGKAGLLGAALDKFAADVATMSDGKLTIKTYHSGELVGGLEALDAVQSGTAQMGFGAPYYWEGKSDSISFVAAMPYGLNAQEQNAWFYYGGGIEMADRLSYNPLGVKFLPMGNTGNQMGGWYAKEINTVDDLDGLKFRMPGLGGEVLKTFGVNVVLLPGNEVLPALTSGAIDGTEWIGPAADLGAGFFKVVNNYYYPGWHEPATVLDSFFDMQAWEALDDQTRGIVERAAASTNLWILSRFQAVNNASLQKLVNENGVNLRPYSDELLQAIGERTAEVVRDRASVSPEASELYNSLIEWRRTMVEWSGISEGKFMNARTSAKFEAI
ncbi:monocarboxylate 2-oxoacid-binding periplasmic protein [Maritalea myrionectae]|uniref:Monocarboxylate 2-oxoacid-binding periplasmic protein n=1 Tax=Maritalea myrionectae TaxID=454601 RepID=A0A2R4MB64_9HYPH|nr:TRAP transporter substrate-binding protein [Maritalea myrionectae]AVX03213.1 monocarboxylate 2-oxoacid-binding periplasmic protein [Maritalea myrionectae]